ncbi:hypothetical protein [Corynebacterium sp. NML130628]|uniref:hypothetical protein n=1 Tax=Corynebacterium sp. NML130628 TaxID=1906333 RepID=UPI0011606C80|nr:hypothetical protein [Corynebacterium sp. NML130628]
MAPLFGGGVVLRVIDHVFVAYFASFYEGAGQGDFIVCLVGFSWVFVWFCGGGGVVDYFQGDFCD